MDLGLRFFRVKARVYGSRVTVWGYCFLGLRFRVDGFRVKVWS